MANIYELTKEFQALQSLLEGADDDMSEAIKDTMAGFGGEAGDAVEQSVKLIKNIEPDLAGIESEIDRLTQRKKQIVNRIDSVRNSIKLMMEIAGYDKVTTQLFTVTLAKGRDSVNVTDQSLLPDDFVVVKTTIAPDKTAIAAAIKDGKEVPGAALVTGEKSLRIK